LGLQETRTCGALCRQDACDLQGNQNAIGIDINPSICYKNEAQQQMPIPFRSSIIVARLDFYLITSPLSEPRQK